jgi:hypothetical protein
MFVIYFPQNAFSIIMAALNLPLGVVGTAFISLKYFLAAGLLPMICFNCSAGFLNIFASLSGRPTTTH